MINELHKSRFNKNVYYYKLLYTGKVRNVYKIDENGKKLEPVEEVIIDVDDEYASTVIDSMNKRKAEMRPRFDESIIDLKIN